MPAQTGRGPAGPCGGFGGPHRRVFHRGSTAGVGAAAGGGQETRRRIRELDEFVSEF